ncbi:PREDICTED: sulfotransferase 1C4-like [Nicrophorus vespilloides]|uniref:Sulfotransferase 1C4-like n=1 Tax=Nicrophorus vespilloides TaxID=110193 RepID=A0ABM1N5K8_NICVS|nr:PREDICTED: sulfotransferase 1C4-like [Nicrophorus vespilloides]
MGPNLDEILERKFTSVFRKGYRKYGKFTLPARFEDLRTEIDDFEVFDDDVWVCSFPKTGTTWTQEMVWLICNDFDYVKAEENLGARFPFLEVSAVFDFRDLISENDEFKPPVFIENSLEFTKNCPRPRMIKTHLPWDLLPRAIREFQVKPKIIYVSRNPKDTCVSYFHHARLFEGFSGDFRDFAQLFIAGKVSFGPFFDNFLSFWNVKDQKNLLFIKYEDMKMDLGEVMETVAKFVGKTLSEIEKSKLLKHLSFEEMKRNPAVNFEPVLEFHRRFNLVKVDGVFMRSGVRRLD